MFLASEVGGLVASEALKVVAASATSDASPYDAPPRTKIQQMHSASPAAMATDDKICAVVHAVCWFCMHFASDSWMMALDYCSTLSLLLLYKGSPGCMKETEFASLLTR
jgi:hypothetical protein